MFKVIRLYWHTIRQIDKKGIFVCMAYNFIKQLLNVFYGVYFLRLILVHVETDQNMKAVLAVLFVMLAINVVFYFFDHYFKEVYMPAFETKLQQYTYEMIADKAAGISYEQYNRPAFLDLYRRLMENTAPNMIKIFRSFGTMAGLLEAFVLVALYVVRVDWFAIFLSVLPLFYSYVVGSNAAKYRQKLDKELVRPARKKEYAKRVFYLPQYAKELKMTSVSGLVTKIFDEGIKETICIYQKNGKKIGLFNFMELVIGDVMIIMIPIAYVAVRILTGHALFIGDFVGIAQSITTFGWDIEWFFDEIITVKSSLLYVQEYQEYCAFCQESQKGGLKPDLSKGFVLSCIDAAYSYPGIGGKEYALHDINVTLKSGEMIAVVGENGAGKTTFTCMLTNLLSCTRGRVLLNGADIMEYSPDALREFLGVVSQDFHLFPLSVRENMCAGSGLSDDRIWEALGSMGIAHKIRNLDVQITREFSDDGLVLSGGEGQRLALARVVAKQYPFVILDEPTSALDPITEREINKQVMEAMADPKRTLLFISHKLSTTRLVDRILVFKDGTIIEEGNHGQLMKKKGHYYEMYTTQQSMYEQG